VHNWGEENVDWEGINDAGIYIGDWLAKWTRLQVTQIKEKYGTVRVYCGFGWSCLYSIYRPRYCWVPKWWPYKLDLFLSRYLMGGINKMFVPIQMKAYRWRYKKAIQKWPHLKEEILCCADWSELLQDI
jgi:hypothetical protein